jgi:hypothetical protein
MIDRTAAFGRLGIPAPLVALLMWIGSFIAVAIGLRLGGSAYGERAAEALS